MPNFRAPVAMLRNIPIYYVFATLAPQKHPKRSILATFGPTMSARPQFEVKIGPNLAPREPYLKPGDLRKGHLGSTTSNKTTLPCNKVPRIIRVKDRKALKCSINLTAIELKGLAPPGEALKNEKMLCRG